MYEHIAYRQTDRQTHLHRREGAGVPQCPRRSALQLELPQRLLLQIDGERGEWFSNKIDSFHGYEYEASNFLGMETLSLIPTSGVRDTWIGWPQIDRVPVDLPSADSSPLF